MPQAIAAALVKIGVNVVIAELVAVIAVNYALSRVSRLLTGKPRRFEPDTTQTVTVTDSVAPRMIIYGQVRTSGVLIFYGASEISSSRLWMTIAIAGHQCEEMTDVWFDNVQISDSDIDPGDGSVTGGTYTGAVNIYRQLGTSSQTAVSRQVTEIAAWDSNHKGTGIANMSVRMLSDSTRDATATPIFPDGAPRDFFVMTKGRRVYDPRLDSTNGGSGSHRLTNPSTWAWSNNSALCIADYITGGSQWYDTSSITQRLGMNESTSRIDWTNFAAQADICDQTPAIPGGTQKRFTCNGELSCGETHSENLSKLLSSCAGQLVYRGGKYRLYVGAYASPSHTISDSDLTGPYQVFASKKRADLYNAVSGVFIDPLQNYQPVPCPLRTDSSYETEDGVRIIRSIDLPMTSDTYTAQRLCEIAKRQSRNQRTGFITLGLNGFKIATMETFNLALAEEWVGNVVVRATDFKLIPENPPKIQVTWAEESSSAYDDQDDTDYGDASTTTPVPNSNEVPTAPSNPRTVSQPNAILLAWDPSPTRGVIYVVYESTSVSMSSPTEVYRGADAQVVLPKSVTTTYYYNIRAYNGQYSGYLPSVNGISGHALVSDTTFTATITPGSLYRRVSVASGTTSSATATPSLGVAPYTYAWAYVSGDATMTANSASSATTTFTRATMTLHNSYTTVWRVTITDNTSATATADITVTIERENDV